MNRYTLVLILNLLIMNSAFADDVVSADSEDAVQEQQQKKSPVLSHQAWQLLFKYKNMRMMDTKPSAAQITNCPRDDKGIARINVGDQTPEFKLFTLDPKTGTEARPLHLGLFYNIDSEGKFGSSEVGVCNVHKLSQVSETAQTVSVTDVTTHKCPGKPDKVYKTTTTVAIEKRQIKLKIQYDPARNGSRATCEYIGNERK